MGKKITLTTHDGKKIGTHELRGSQTPRFLWKGDVLYEQVDADTMRLHPAQEAPQQETK